MLFRPVRELLPESINEIIEVDSIKQLVKKLELKGVLTFKYQGFDRRINWDSWLLLENGYPVGYINKDPMSQDS